MIKKQLMTDEQTHQLESEHIVYEERLKQLHHLLIVMENEFNDIRKVYLMATGKDITDEDYMLQYMDQFESLLGIAINTSETHKIKTKVR